MKINQKSNKLTSSTKEQKNHGHLNHMNGVSYSINDPILKLRIVASSCFFGEPMYYHDESKISSKKTPTNKTSKQTSYLENTLGDILQIPDYQNFSPSKLIETVIDEALNYNPEATLIEAVRLRNEEHMRVTPQVIMVRAANSTNVRGTSLISKYGQEIMKRTDDAITQLAYQVKVFGKPIPNSLKKAWKKFIESKDAYQLAKYKLENKEFKLFDIINLTHAYNEDIDKLMKGNLTNQEKTWESYISKNGSNKETWTQSVELMGHMALLRNLKNLSKNSVDEEKYLPKLLNTVVNGKQLPFRYYSAYKAIENEKVSSNLLDTIEECLEKSLTNLPTFKGKVMSLCDNSGSATGTMTSSLGSVKVSEIANLTAIITGKCAEDGYVGVFGDRLEVVPVRKKASIFDQLKTVNKIGDEIGGGTETGIWLFFDKAIKEKQHWDHIFVYSDMQAGHGGLYGRYPAEYSKHKWFNSDHIDVASLIKTYRETVNKNVNVYLIQMAGYQDTLAPEFYDKTFILGGWGEGLLKFADSMSKNLK